VLGPLAELAAELKIAILGLLHFNKKTDVTNIMLRISDSIAFVAAARAVYAVIPDDENKRTLLVRGKNNLAPATLDKTLAYTITVANVGTDPETGAVIMAPHVLWFPKHVDITASEAMQAAADDRSPGQIEAAVHFLDDLLTEGAVENSEVEEAAEIEKIAERTLRRAGTKLAIEKRKQKGVKDGKWYWRLPNKGHPWPWEVEKDSDKI
jgi:putative DNA primase/helicase